MICLKCGVDVPDLSAACPRCATTTILPAARPSAPASIEWRATPATVGNLSRPVGFWIRFAARLIDSVIVVILFIAFLALLEMLGTPEASALQELKRDWSTNSIAAIPLLIYTVYEVGYLAIWGSTVGKRAFGLVVVGSNGNCLSLPSAFLRWVSCLISIATLCSGPLTVVFDRRKRGWHDRVAGSYVVRSA